MYCYQGKEHFCSILFTSQKPENVKTTLVKCLLRDPENSELLFFFYCFLLLKMMKKCEFQRVWRGKKETAQVSGPSYLGLTLSSGKLALSLLYFPKGIQPHNLIDISLSETSLGTQVHPLQAFTNQMASPNSKPLPLVSILLVCALLAVKAGTKKASE